MYIAPADATLGEAEWRPFVEATGFGHLVAAGRDRDVPVVVPTQFLLEGDTVRLHLVRANPLFAALAENPRVVLSVAGDWAFIPSAWKAIGDEDPELGIPTTYYAAVQLTGTATVHDERHDPGSVAAVLRRQLQRPPTRARRRGPRRRASPTDPVHPRHQHRRRGGVGEVQVRRQRRRSPPPRRRRSPRSSARPR